MDFSMIYRGLYIVHTSIFNIFCLKKVVLRWCWLYLKDVRLLFWWAASLVFFSLIVDRECNARFSLILGYFSSGHRHTVIVLSSAYRLHNFSIVSFLNVFFEVWAHISPTKVYSANISFQKHRKALLFWQKITLLTTFSFSWLCP